jgi:hypothetical protein
VLFGTDWTLEIIRAGMVFTLVIVVLVPLHDAATNVADGQLGPIVFADQAREAVIYDRVCKYFICYFTKQHILIY